MQPSPPLRSEQGSAGAEKRNARSHGAWSARQSRRPRHLSGLIPRSAAYSAEIEHKIGLKQFLPHRRNQVGAASEHANVSGVLGQTHRKLHQAVRGRSSLNCGRLNPHLRAGASRRAGSSGCRSGPLPLNQSDPPCSRKRSGAVGSMPSVRLITFAFFLARSRPALAPA